MAIDDHNKDPESHADIRQAVKDTVNTHNSDETSRTSGWPCLDWTAASPCWS